MVLGSKSAHWNRGGKGGKKGLLTTIRGRRSHLLWSSPDPSPVLALARRQEEVAGRGSSPEGTEERRELTGGKGGKEVAGWGSSARSRRRRAVAAAAMEGAAAADTGAAQSGRNGGCLAGSLSSLAS